MEDKTIITICRQFCSGGLETGKKLSERLNMHFYDKELISIAAKESGLTQNIFENADEKPTKSLLYSIAMGSASLSNVFFQNNDFLTNDKLFSIQSNVIKNIAKTNSAIIVGRCSDYILRENKNLVRVYLRADLDFRINRLLKDNKKIDPSDAEHILHKTDKKRRNYYNYYTGNDWHNIDNYDLVINTSKIGIDNAVDQIIQYSKNLASK